MGYILQFEMWCTTTTDPEDQGKFFHWNGSYVYPKPQVSRRELERERDLFLENHPGMTARLDTFKVIKRFDVYTGEWV
jgi:hypothetical protein